VLVQLNVNGAPAVIVVGKRETTIVGAAGATVVMISVNCALVPIEFVAVQMHVDG
jgi:hypothetical protein